MKRNKRKGFAIILVASLAGLVFLLGASLVVVTHLQTAAANYDQRVRLAREHARASLDMAIAELQDKLGKDTAVSYYADVWRENKNEDFKDAAATGVREPFWTAARNGGTTSWLVTRELDGSVKSPIGEFTGDSIKLLGSRTLGNNPLLEVSVPKESIQVDEVDGFTDARTIGHYAYWVGDLGTKASYALYDKHDQVSHDDYDANKQKRLSQLRLSKPALSIVNTDAAGVESDFPSNPWRIDRFANDFQFRDGYGRDDDPIDPLNKIPGNNSVDRMLIKLDADEVEDYFQDFTPLSKGLLVNSANGLPRKDLSFSYSTGDANLDAYAKLARNAPATATNYTNDVFSMRKADGSGPGIHPVLTQFHLEYEIYLQPTSGTNKLWLAFSARFELWNPFTSALKAEVIRLEVKGLPNIKISLIPATYRNLNNPHRDPILNPEPDPLTVPTFRIPSAISGASFWKPGQIVTFSGPKASNAGIAPFLLSEGILNSSTSWVDFDLDSDDIGGSPPSIPFSFELPDGTPDPAHIVVEMYLDSTNELLATYTLPESYAYDADPGSVDLSVLGKSGGAFGFSWEISDDQLILRDHYHPMNGQLEVEALSGFESDSQASVNTSPSFEEATGVHLLGPNPTETDTPRDPFYDLPMFQLPKQELTSVAQLSGAYGTSWVSARIGDPVGSGNTMNSLFDSTFYSTVGKVGGEWNDISMPVPNSGYVPRFGAALANVQSVDSTEELFVHGMFNVHSTSIDSWAALLKGCPSASSTYWSSVFGNNMYLFFNYPLGGEDSYQAPESTPSDGSLEAFRASLRRNVIALSEGEVEQLARFIVSKIRTRVQNSGPFNSLEEFVNSGILQSAIDENYYVTEAEESGDKRLNASWVVEGSAAEFRQSTILNLIAPYLSVRSDTFLVRAYGDAVDPSDPSKIWARAYCEAILQRVHEDHGDGTLGRDFRVEAFRWLSPSEI